MIIIGIIIVTGGVAVFAKDAEIFDIFFSDKVKDERALNRMAKLYPEIMGDYVLYSWNAEKVQKRAECEGEICSRYTIGQYRMDGSNKVVFVHIYKATKGTEIFKNVLLNMLSSEKFGEYKQLAVHYIWEDLWWTRQKLAHLGGQVLNIILPRKCAGCGLPREVFCEKCLLASYKPGTQCLICGFRNKDGGVCSGCLKKTGFRFKRVFWAGHYDGALREAVWQLKYKILRPF